VQRRIENAGFALQRRVLCMPPVEVLHCTLAKMSPENAAAKYQSTGLHRLKLERQ
jgi:hypothetical protein